MKYVNILIGFISFSVFISLILAIAYDMDLDYGSNNQAAIVELQNDYNFIEEFSTDSNSTLRDIDAATAGGQLDDEDDDSFIGGVVDAAKLIGGSVTTSYKVTKKVTIDMGVHPLIFTAITGVFAVVFILFILVMLSRFKPEL